MLILALSFHFNSLEFLFYICRRYTCWISTKRDIVKLYKKVVDLKVFRRSSLLHLQYHWSVYHESITFVMYSKSDHFYSKQCLKAATEVFWKKGIFLNFPEFTGKHLCRSLTFMKKGSGTGVLLWILRNF